MSRVAALPPWVETTVGVLGGSASAVAVGAVARAVGLPAGPAWLLLLLGAAVGLHSAGAIAGPSGHGWLLRGGAAGLLRGSLLLGLLATCAGIPSLLPLGATIMASIHLQHAGSRAWKSAISCTLGTSLSGMVVTAMLDHSGLRVFALTPGQQGVTDLVVLLGGLGIIATTARVISQREAGEAALAAERAARHAELLHASQHDHLTGVLNRAGLSGAIEQALRSAAPGHGVGLLYLDLDGFKAVNDTLGHQAGDELLVCVARRLQDAVRPGDRVARLGGDEFVVLVTDLAGPDVLAGLGDRTEQALVRPYDLHGLPATIGASIGTAMTEEALASADDLFARADRAMYEVKSRHHRATAGV